MIVDCICGRCGKPFRRLRRRGNMTQCSKCTNALRVQAWHLANPHKPRGKPSKEVQNRYAKSEKGKQRGREGALRFYHKHKDDPVMREKFRAVCRRNYSRHSDAYKQRAVERKAYVKRAMPPWANREAIADVYRQAREMTAATGIKYTVDHIVPLRAKHVSGLHVPHNLQILTLSENCSKRNSFEVQG